MKLMATRWAILGVFLLVEGVALQTLDVGLAFTALTLINLGACAVLLFRLRGPAQRTVWAWTMLGIFLVGYFLKMAWFAPKVAQPFRLARNYPELGSLTADRLIRAYPWVTLGFASFCLTAAVTLGRRRSQPPPSPVASPRAIRANGAMHLAIGVTLVYGIATVIQFWLQYGVLGAANPTLPLGLGSALTLFRKSLAPALLLLAVFVFDGSKPANTRTMVGLLLGMACVESLVSTSRAAILLATAPVFFLWLFTNRLTRARRLGSLLVALFVVMLFPVISSLRLARLNLSDNAPVVISVGALVENASLVVNRITAGGIDGVWQSIGHTGEPSIQRTASFLRPRSMIETFTTDVVGVSTPNDYRAPGVLGGLMIIGGEFAVACGMVMVTLIIYRMWTRLRRLETAPVALALMTSTTAVFMTTGGLEYLLFIKLAAVIVLLEIVYRKLLSGSGHDRSSFPRGVRRKTPPNSASRH